MKQTLIKFVNLKVLKPNALIMIVFIMLNLLFNCKSTQELDAKLPLKIGQVYCTTWVQNDNLMGEIMYVPIVSNPDHVVLESVYFNDQTVILHVQDNGDYIGYFKNEIHKGPDIIVSSNPKEEFGNQVPHLKKPILYTLKDNECVIGYKDGKTVKYFKVGNIIKK